MDTTKFILAAKYADAFLNLYGYSLDFDTILRVDKLAEFLNNNKRDLFYIQIFEGKSDLFKAAFYKLLTEFGLDDNFRKLIDLLIEKHRLLLLIDLLKKISSEYKIKHNISNFTIESAHELTNDELNQFKLFLEKKTNTTVYYTAIINPKLIAGVKIYSDNYGWEYSVSQNLHKLDHIWK